MVSNQLLNIKTFNDSLKLIQSHLIPKYTMAEIQAEIVRVFLEKHKINEYKIKNNLVKELLVEKNESIYTYIRNLNIDWTFENLESAFYLHFDEEVISENGIVYTPAYIANYINEKVMDNARKNSSVIDLSCGAGVFLLSAVKQFKKKFPHISVVEIIEKNIYGFDIFQENVFSTKLLLTLYALLEHEDPELIHFNIICRDMLETDVLTAFKNKEDGSKFDFIVGNPPYVKIQDLNKRQKSILSETYQSCRSGSYNLFYAFIEASFHLVNTHGKIGYIVPNHLLKMKSAQSLRKLLVENKYIQKVIDFKDHQLFSNAQTYSSILFFDQKEKDVINYHVVTQSMTDLEMESYLEKIEFDSIQYNDVNIETINLLSEKDLHNIRRIESQAYSLKISTGIATQKDQLYMIEMSKNRSLFEDDEYYYKEYNGVSYPIEKEITIQIIKGSGARRIDSVSNLYDLNRIIYPYENINGKATVIREEKMKEKFPKTYDYFVAIEKELGKRNGGNPKTKIWYEYGRAQALNSYIPKIIFPTNSSKPNFVYFDTHALFHNGYAIYGVNEEGSAIDLPNLEKILNSEVMHYYIKLTSYMISGGYYCYQKKYLEKFTIPKFSKEELLDLEAFTDQQEITQFILNKYMIESIS